METPYHIESHNRLERNVESLLAGQVQVIDRLAKLEGKASRSGAVWGTISGGFLGVLASIVPKVF